MKSKFKFLSTTSLVALLTIVSACNSTDNSDSSSQDSPSTSSDSIAPSIDSTTIEVSSNESIYDSSTTSAETIFTRVYSVLKPDTFVDFEKNKSEQENKRTEFADLTKTYVVGDDNSINVLPNTSFVLYNSSSQTIEPTDVESWDYSISLAIKQGEEYVDVLNNSQYVDSIDETACLIDLSSYAVGHSFKITIIPEGLTTAQSAEDKISEYTVELEVDVVDGYNCYSALDLAYINNASNQAAWTEFKKEKGLQENYFPSTMILQTNIEVSDDDIPSIYFFSEDEIGVNDSDRERAIGSLKDREGIFYRNVANGNQFNMLGNYFTLDASSISTVVRQENEITPEGRVISHSVLFKYEGSANGEVVMSDMNLIGNAPRSENGVLSGGIILTKSDDVIFTANNNIAICWYISYFVNKQTESYKVENCKSYNNFNCFIYNYGSDTLALTNCEFIGAGGPVIIQDDVEATANDPRLIAKTTAVNCDLQSYVTGKEGWFDIVGATAVVPNILALDQLFTPFGRSYIKKSSDGLLSYFNLICVNKSSAAEGLTSVKVDGSLKFDDCAAFDFGATNPYIKAMLESTFANGAPAFQTSTGGYGWTDAKTGIFDVTNTQIVDPTNAMYSGDYLCLYYQGMGITIGYGVSGQTISE